MINSYFLNQVSGKISQHVCEKLAELAVNVPPNGVILDLNCGEGRSTISMSMALTEAHNYDVSIMAVDTHITNPLSSSPHEDGTLMKFLRNLRSNICLHRVVPMVMPSTKVLEVLNRKCANLVVVQTRSADTTTLSQHIEVAKFALRAKGTIAVCLDSPVGSLDFPATTFRMTYQSSELLVYESFRKGEA